MLNMGGMEIVVIVVVALLVLGPDKLPGLMRTIGKATKELRRASTEFQRSINTDIEDENTSKPLVSPPQDVMPDTLPPDPTAQTVAQASVTLPAEPASIDNKTETERGEKSTLRRAPSAPSRNRTMAAKPLLRKKSALRQDFGTSNTEES